jgi:hypothetical protein
VKTIMAASNSQIIIRNPTTQPSTSTNLVTQSAIEEARLSAGSSSNMYSMYKPDVSKCELQKLLQAIVDDDRTAAQKIVNAHPELLLEEPADKKILFIESKYTFQRFLTEKALVMAQKLHRLEVTKILVAAFEKLEASQVVGKTDAKDEKSALQTQWVLSPYDEKQKLANQKLREQYRRDYLVPLANTFMADPCNQSINSETKILINELCRILLPEHPVNIDFYIDPEQFLAAAYETYDAYFNRMTNKQFYRFAVCAIGLAQSLISPELAKAYCHPSGFYNYALDRTLPFDHLAMDLRRYTGSLFYPSIRCSAAFMLPRSMWQRSFEDAPHVDGAICQKMGTSTSAIFISYIEQDRQSLANLHGEYQVRRDMMLRL